MLVIVVLSSFDIPINPFFDIINQLEINIFTIDSSEKYIITSIPKYNISHVDIINKHVETITIPTVIA